MGTVIAARLKEAREYLGFTQADVATALGCQPEFVAGMEQGTVTLTGKEVARLSRLYRRPVAWLTGNIQFQPSPDLLRKVEHLHPGDREAVLDFAEFLDGAGPPAKPVRKDGR